MPHPPHIAAPQDRISWPRLLAYGSGGIIPIALFNIAGQLMGVIGNIGLGLSAFWLGVIMIFPRLWDAVSDPLMGHLSDNTRTRWGRRRPYIFIGGLLVAISFAGMWWVPDDISEWGQLAFILGGLLIFFTACTVFEIPHGALGMEMSKDPHERTRLFSSKSFFGNLFAMGTPWLLFFAGLKVVRGTGGTLVDGMRVTSLIIAAIMIPLVIWWFLGTREPGYAHAQNQQKPKFWPNMKATIRNRTFLCLILIIFTLAMGFNFVGLFNYYISIYYLFGGDQYAAGALLGINGTVWAVTGLVAVFPLNWISPRIGKRKTLLLAIGLMCAAQLSKIVCYNPELPYLVIIPTILLSMGMLMFFTLGASMVGDICDEDELNTGTRSEGSYYSVYWWFIKMGTAFASFVTGALLVATQFNETQSKQTAELYGCYEIIAHDAQTWATEGEPTTAATTKEHIELWLNQRFGNEKDLSLRTDNNERLEKLSEQLTKTLTLATEFATNLEDSATTNPTDAAHTNQLSQSLFQITERTQNLQAEAGNWVGKPESLQAEVQEILHEATVLSVQAPRTLLMLRIIEIGLPLVLSAISILLTLRYPLTEERCYEIKALLEARKQDEATH
jgi:glycoside/pentoside/hexuronide:cation symporter, GPH family